MKRGEFGEYRQAASATRQGCCPMPTKRRSRFFSWPFSREYFVLGSIFFVVGECCDLTTDWLSNGRTLSKLGQKRSKKKTQLVRLGEREIETLGLSQGFWSDLYHRSMAVSWPVFFGSAAALF